MYYSLFDSHTHSQNSPDGKHSVMLMAETAINKGIKGFAVTDHCEGVGFEERNFSKCIAQSMADTENVKKALGDRIDISSGVEIAEVFYNIEAIENVLERHSFDFVIGSVHRLTREKINFYDFDFSKITSEEMHGYFLKYFDEVLDLINWGKFDVLAHLTLFAKYPKIHYAIDVDLTQYKEHIDAMLKLAVEKGKGIEINTSGLRNAMRETMPPLWVLKRLRELGGELVTLGSDAHVAGDIGGGIPYAMQMLVDAGFEYFAFYKKRKPVMYKIL